MEVILLEKVHKLGKMGDSVKVADGFGRNYLIPQGKAIPATKKNREEFQARRAEFEKVATEQLNEAQQRAEAIRNLQLKMPDKSGEEGKLYGSIGTKEIATAITQAGVKVLKSEIRLPNGPLRTLGEHEVVLHLHTDIDETIKLEVVPEE